MTSDQPVLDADRYPTLPTVRPTVRESSLAQWFEAQHIQSIDNLERMACELIALCTTLLTILLGLVALVETPLPAYMASPLIRWLGMVGVIALFTALASALMVVFPGALTIKLNDPAELTAAYDQLLAYKNSRLKFAIVLFSVAMLCITGVIIGALWLV